MKRLLYVSTGLGRGGAETQVVALARTFRARGWDVRVVTLIPPAAFADELAAAGVPVVSLGMRRGRPTLGGLLAYVRLVRDWRPDVIHAHMVHANLLTRVLRPLAPAPVVISTAHSVDEGGRFRERLYRLTDPLADLTTNVSRAAVERYVAVGAAPAGRIRFVPNGVDLHRFQPDPERRARVREALGVDGFLWLTVGRFEPPKDYPNLVSALAALGDGPWSLAVAGDGPLRSETEALVAARDLTGHVRLLGPRTDVPDLLCAADGFVLASAWEGLPMVLLEAAATGLPIVCTDVGGNGEVVEDGVTGRLVPARDAAALGAAMAALMQTPRDARGAMGAAGAAHVRRAFDLERVADLWSSIYTDGQRNRGGM